MEETMTHFTRLPPITLSAADRDRLEQLANASIAHFPQTADYLAWEVERARVLEPGDDGRAFVSMGAWVAFRDDRGQTRHVWLVFPEEADVSADKISVLTPSAQHSLDFQRTNRLNGKLLPVSGVY
jgi:regulator of nucleoside diphosphate kinase